MKFDSRFHGTSGPLKKTFPDYIDEFALPWLQAAKAIGIPSNSDPVCTMRYPLHLYSSFRRQNDGDNTGFWTATKAIDTNAIRSSAATVGMISISEIDADMNDEMYRHIMRTIDHGPTSRLLQMHA